MSEEKSFTPKGLVAIIAAALNLGDEGKLASFFAREERDLERSIKGRETNILTLKHNRDSRVLEIEDQIEDQGQALEEAYTNITPEDVATNADQRSFSKQYWAEVENASTLLEGMKKSILDLDKNLSIGIEAEEKQISKLQARLDKIRG